MKRILLSLIIAVMLLAVVACGPTKTVDTTPSDMPSDKPVDVKPTEPLNEQEELANDVTNITDEIDLEELEGLDEELAELESLTLE